MSKFDPTSYLMGVMDVRKMVALGLPSIEETVAYGKMTLNSKDDLAILENFSQTATAVTNNYLNGIDRLVEELQSLQMSYGAKN